MLVSEIMPDIREILGRADDATIFRRLTDAVTVLSNKGRWNPCLGYVDICAATDRGTFTLPWDVDTPLAVMIDGQPMIMRNKWAEFHINGDAGMQRVNYTWDDTGRFATFRDMIEPSRLICVADLQTDLNRKIRVIGYDQEGRYIRSQNPDGSFIDGFYLPINILADYADGMIIDDPDRRFVRDFTITPLSMLDLASSNNSFMTGQLAILTATVPPIPSPLLADTGYYLRVDGDTVTLHVTRSGALTGSGAVQFSSIDVGSTLNLRDERKIEVETLFQSPTPHLFSTGSLLEISGFILPTPLVEDTDYYARVVDANSFTVHASKTDAENNVDPINMTDAGSSVVARLKEISNPITRFSFQVPHNLKQGDQVTVVSPSGGVPPPLVPNISYYVRYIDSKTVTLHYTLASANAGTDPIALTGAGSGVSSLVKTANATASIGTTSQITSPSHGLTVGDYVQFSSSGAFPSVEIPPGSGSIGTLAQSTVYRVKGPVSTDTFTVETTAGQEISFLSSGGGQLLIVVSRVFSTGFTGVIQTDATNLSTGTTVKLDTSVAFPQATPTIDPDAQYYVRKIDDKQIELYESEAGSLFSPKSVSQRGRASDVATLQVVGHGFVTNDYVEVAGVAETLNGALTEINVTVQGSSYVDGETATITSSGKTATGTVKASPATGVTVNSGGSGWAVGMETTLRSGTGKIAKGIVTYDGSNALATVTVNSGGTGYTTNTTVTLTGDTSGAVATGIITVSGGGNPITAVAVTSAGYGFIALESLTMTGAGGSGAVLKVGTTSNVNAGQIKAISISDGGSGFVNGETVSISGLGTTGSGTLAVNTGKLVDVTINYPGSGFTLLSTLTLTVTTGSGATITPKTVVNGYANTPNAYNVERVQVTVTDADHFTYTSVGPNEPTTTVTEGIVDAAKLLILGFGEGIFYVVRERGVDTVPASTNFRIPDGSYIKSGAQVTLITTGTLPAPFTTSTTYIAVVNGESVTLKDISETVVNINNIGSGDHAVVIEAEFNPVASTTLEVPSNNYINGDLVTIETTGTLPSPILVQDYYVRRINDGQIELYDTAEHATDLEAITGRLSYTSEGEPNNSLVQIIPNYLVSRIERIHKELSDGVMRIYAWDTGRNDNITVIGELQPFETLPQYRRIRIPNSCQTWIRIRYKKRFFRIQSENDFIPISSSMAIVFAVRALELMRDNFVEQGGKMMDTAVGLLEDEKIIEEGPAVALLQVNDRVGTNPSDHME